MSNINDNLNVIMEVLGTFHQFPLVPDFLNYLNKCCVFVLVKARAKEREGLNVGEDTKTPTVLLQ